MNEFLHDLADRLVDGLKGLGVTEDTARLVVGSSISGVTADYSGERIYIAGKDRMQRELSARNRAIIRDWRAGERPALLMRRYGISKSRLYQIING